MTLSESQRRALQGLPGFGVEESEPETPVVVASSRYDSADLLLMCKRNSGRPAVDAQVDDTEWYRYLTEAQDAILPEIATRAPEALAGQYAQLTTSDGGLTYQFGTDLYGEPVQPLGHVEVWARNGGRELFASSYGPRGGDFVIDGPNVRMPAGAARTFTSGPYARWVGAPAAISADGQPILFPRPMRVLLVYWAVMLWSERGARRDPAPWRLAYRREWMGDQQLGHLGWCAYLQTRFKTRETPARGHDEYPWWQLL